MERPVLISVAGGARKLVEDAGACEFVEPETPAAMAGAIERLKSDPARLAEMGRRGRKFVIENFDRARLAQKYLELLAGL